jgi:aryl-alcohol dehydrogenase-like predicted oxidoreductase
LGSAPSVHAGAQSRQCPERRRRWSRLLGPYRALASAAGSTPAELALAWVRHRAPHVIAIAGTTSRAQLAQNVDAAVVRLEPG